MIVISSHDGRESVFRALELGAIDFVAKPSAMLTGQTEAIRAQLDQVVALVRQLAPSGPWRKSRGTADLGQPRAASSGVSGVQSRPSQPVAHIRRDPTRILGIAASTGGPTALMELFAPLSETSPAAIFVEHFAGALHQELRRAARQDQPLPRPRSGAQATKSCRARRSFARAGAASRCMKQVDELVVRVVYPASTDRRAPSADRLLSSLAKAAGDKAIAVVLTGMGDDARRARST